MTTANMKTVILDIEVGSIHDALPKQQLDTGEHIICRVVPFDDLKAVLDGSRSLFDRLNPHS